MLKIKLRPCVDRGCSLGDGAIGAACRILRVDIGWPRLHYTWSEHCCDSRRIPSLFQSDHATFNKYEYTLNTSRCIPTSADLILKTHHDRYKQITFPRVTSSRAVSTFERWIRCTRWIRWTIIDTIRSVIDIRDWLLHERLLRDKLKSATTRKFHCIQYFFAPEQEIYDRHRAIDHYMDSN